MNYCKVPGRKVPIIAIVGTDGSGKTTVSHELLRFMSDYRPTTLCHLGKQTGNLRRAMRKNPLGKKVDSRISKVGASARKKGISFPVALVMFIASMRRVIRFTRMCFFRGMGRAILTDRYPQTVEPGEMDGPHLTGRKLTDGGAKMLMHVEFWLYKKMAAVTPDVVLRLNVDLETAIRRKPDHIPASLEKKINVVPKLSFNGAPIVDIDSTQPLEVVLEQSRAVVSAVMKNY
ncbi:nucleoside triphosphate hydrolase [Pseudomonas agarici]|uniref:nucleoside triphosphate hydrolase n=1 Tax=Pseudomonas agarici TaxID=46677 RepID=UPI000585BF90|nr:nucleoside triphosphate hydrolase [Pseudomonas agarici]NWC08949.1 nucleoside triphosphate hydrolase [Pseudomonas agarici]SEL75842.1 Thymidylate kinase [Pseudomonas agarici]